ncbi:unnamed protein product [Candidula unifasciata]|uniref:Aspartyl/asparaginy/proline hydroxylase domain-containing protein n=1 Tax=Candidula unifasciata TaxID=100452 RepID=A0A8S3ZCH5_9EUPU|nr:unnamed protein product [Candidula unifasciata]
MIDFLSGLFLALLSLVAVVKAITLYKSKVTQHRCDGVTETSLSADSQLQSSTSLSHCRSPGCYRCSNNQGTLQTALTRLSYYAHGDNSAKDGTAFVSLLSVSFSPHNWFLHYYPLFIDSLKVPGDDCKLYVGDQTCCWQEGKVLCFNDAFPHSVEHTGAAPGSSLRAVFMLDLWHPDITKTQKDILNYTFSA